MFKAFYSWKDVRFQKCAQTILFQKQHGAGRNDWRVKAKKQTINFYRQNHILRDNADPNYRNITVKPAGVFREMLPFFKKINDSKKKKSANGNESRWKFCKDLDH